MQNRLCDHVLRSGERGFALIIAMLVIVALTMMGMAAITTTGFENRIAASYQKSKVSFDASDACRHAFRALLVSPDFNMLVDPDDLQGTLDVGGGYLARFRAPVYTDARFIFHSNFDGGSGSTIETRFAVPKHPNPLNRPGQLMPGMNIARRGSQAEGGMWSYRIWEVQCEGWIEHPDTRNFCGNDPFSDCAVQWSTSYHSSWVGDAVLMAGEFAEGAGQTGH